MAAAIGFYGSPENFGRHDVGRDTRIMRKTWKEAKMKIKTNVRAGRCTTGGTADRCGGAVRCGGCTRCGGTIVYE